MWREAGEGYWAEESAAISGESDHNWREWEAKRESQYPSSREFGFNDWVSEKFPHLEQRKWWESSEGDIVYLSPSLSREGEKVWVISKCIELFIQYICAIYLELT